MNWRSIIRKFCEWHWHASVRKNKAACTSNLSLVPHQLSSRPPHARKRRRKIQKKFAPYPAISAYIWIALPISSKAWALTTSTLAFGTMTSSETILATLWTSDKEHIIGLNRKWHFTQKRLRIFKWMGLYQESN